MAREHRKWQVRGQRVVERARIYGSEEPIEPLSALASERGMRLRLQLASVLPERPNISYRVKLDGLSGHRVGYPAVTEAIDGLPDEVVCGWRGRLVWATRG